MAKKKHRKKHQFKHAANVKTSERQNVAPSETPAVRVSEAASFGYVAKDVRRIAILAAGFVALQLVLWHLFNHTGLGSAVYRLIRL